MQKFGMFINCKKHPFIDEIFMNGKLYETRTRNVFKKLVGKRLVLVETGKGRPMARGEAVIESVEVVFWDNTFMRHCAMIIGTDYDIKPGHKKYFYRLTNVKKYDEPYPLPTNRINHGRSYTEF